jgi:hypothetical protein
MVGIFYPACELLPPCLLSHLPPLPPFHVEYSIYRQLVGSLKMNTALEYSTRVVQEGDRRCKKSTLNGLAYLTPLRIPLMNPVIVWLWGGGGLSCVVDHILQEFYTLFLTRFRTYKSASPPQTKVTSKDDI